MAIPPRKTAYQRAVERAKARGFDSPYAERKARAKERGYSSPRTELEARRKARGTQRDYGYERMRAEQIARGLGFQSAADRRRFTRESKATGLSQGQWQKERTLAQFGITEAKLNRIRAANRRWNAAEADNREMTQYKTDLDADKDNFTPYRIGYILTYYAANVDPKTNYRDSGKYFTKKGQRKFEYGYRYMDRIQYDLLVTYGDLDESAWRAHYGPVLAI